MVDKAVYLTKEDVDNLKEGKIISKYDGRVIIIPPCRSEDKKLKSELDKLTFLKEQAD